MAANQSTYVCACICCQLRACGAACSGAPVGERRSLLLERPVGCGDTNGCELCGSRGSQVLRSGCSCSRLPNPRRPDRRTRLCCQAQSRIGATADAAVHSRGLQSTRPLIDVYAVKFVDTPSATALVIKGTRALSSLMNLVLVCACVRHRLHSGPPLDKGQSRRVHCE